MSRSIRLPWSKTIILLSLVVLFQGVESAIISKSNPFFQNDQQLAILTKYSENAKPPQPISDSATATITTTRKPTVTIEPPELWGGFLYEVCLNANGQFPSESSCSKYVNCWNGDGVEQTCPTGLLFNPIKLYCDYRENVDCKRKDGVDNTSSSGSTVSASMTGRDDPSNKSQKTQVNDDCPLEFGTFRNQSDCTQYYTCAYKRVAARFHCPPGFRFSDRLGICDYWNRVDCSKAPQIFYRIMLKDVQDSLLPSNAFAHPDLLKPSVIGDTRCSTPYGFSRDSTNCSIYYDCEAGLVRATHVCPPGYSFSTRFDKCEMGENVDCFIPPNNFKKQLLSELPKDVLRQVQNCQPGDIFRLNPQCTTACRCQTHMAEIIQCAAGLAYDSKTDRCLPNSVARC